MNNIKNIRLKNELFDIGDKDLLEYLNSDILEIKEKNDNVDMFAEIKLNGIFFELNVKSKYQSNFKIFKNQKSADYTLLELLDKSNINIHILELKRKIRKDPIEIIDQFLGSFIRTLLVLPFYFENNYIINDIYFYTVYCYEWYEKDGKNESIDIRERIRELNSPCNEDLHDEKIKNLEFWNYKFKHQKIKIVNNMNNLNLGKFEIIHSRIKK